MKKYKGIKKLLKNTKIIAMLGATTISILYMLYITILSLYNYLYNRPYRLVAFTIAIAILFFIGDAIEQNKAKQKANSKAKHLKARTKAMQEQNRTRKMQEQRGC